MHTARSVYPCTLVLTPGLTFREENSDAMQMAATGLTAESTSSRGIENPIPAYALMVVHSLDATELGRTDL